MEMYNTEEEDDMKMYDLYIKLTKQYKIEYGENTVVLLQCGGFYEIYSNLNDCVDMIKMTDFSYLVYSHKQNGVYMMGVPLEAITKYVKIFTDNMYTCVVYNQLGEKKRGSKNFKRELFEIYSPGVKIGESSSNNNTTNMMMTLFLEEHGNGDLLYMGMFVINTNTGDCFCKETSSTYEDMDSAYDDICKMLLEYNPVETLVISETDIKKKDSITRLFGNRYVHWKWGMMKKEYKKPSYQRTLFQKAFKHENVADVLVMLNLTMLNNARIAIVCGLQFVNDHNPKMIMYCKNVEVLNRKDRLIIDYSGIKQINLVDEPNCVHDILNKCCTKFGKRMFRDRLLNPLACSNQIQQRYDRLIDVSQNYDCKAIASMLRKIIDIGAMYRRAVTGKMTTLDWIKYDNSVKICKDVLEIFNNSSAISNVISSYEDIINIDIINNSINPNVFFEGVYDDVDELNSKFVEIYDKLQQIAHDITDIGGGNKTLATVIYNSKTGFDITITKTRYNTAVKINKKLMNFFNHKMINKIGVVYNDNITAMTQKLNEVYNKLDEVVLLRYKEFMESYVKHVDIYTMMDAVADIDVVVCNVINMNRWDLKIPSIVHKDDSSVSSMIDIKGIRHPIIEYVSGGYIPNDVKLSEDGMLLYGINSCGKSSLMKAIGINIILAQAGMAVFVTSSLQYVPYTQIFTRISGTDNIYRGMSSFITEMTELRNILIRCDQNSMVIGDEVCNGTEHTSGTAIVASALNHLSKSKCTFLFATHLHELTDITMVKSNSRIHIKHMSINIKDDVIVYDRKLVDGDGETMYGIEVCRYLRMDKTFLRDAEYIRKDMTGEHHEVLSTKRSNYNKDVYMHMCGVCKEQIAIETHHIVYQKDLDNPTKNLSSNLVPLCKLCHQKEHTGKLKIHGYIDTLKGRELWYEMV